MDLYDEIHTFPLPDGKFLFFDLFLNDSLITMICPKWVDVSNVLIGGNIMISCEETNDWHNTGIKIVKFGAPSENTVHIRYKNVEKTYCLTEKTNETKMSLTMTTLFKNDYYLLGKYIDYYTNQGVEHFYLYYNGPIGDLKPRNPSANVTWLEWNHEYFVDGDSKKDLSHAQFSQLNHALLKYGGLTEYMGFNDLDEYMTLRIKDIKLRDVIEIELLQEEDQRLKTIVFSNTWSTSGSEIPDSFPFAFYASAKCQPYGVRSKCIHRTRYIPLIQNVHTRERMVASDTVSLHTTNFLLFHFYKWSAVEREIDIGEKFPYLMDASGDIHRITM